VDAIDFHHQYKVAQAKVVFLDCRGPKMPIAGIF
jgi:hypothetical protein